MFPKTGIIFNQLMPEMCDFLYECLSVKSAKFSISSNNINQRDDRIASVALTVSKSKS